MALGNHRITKPGTYNREKSVMKSERLRRIRQGILAKNKTGYFGNMLKTRIGKGV